MHYVPLLCIFSCFPSHKYKLFHHEWMQKCSAHRHDRSKVWGHPHNLVFSMKTHTFIHQINCNMNRKYSQDIDKVRNNIEMLMLFFKLVDQRKASFIASLTSITVFSCAHIKRVLKGFLPLR